jgi:hypothetical protein
METADFQQLPIAMDESTDVSDTAQLAVFFPGIDMGVQHK